MRVSVGVFSSRAVVQCGMSDVLTRVAHLPEVELAAGDTLVREDAPGGSLWFLVTGSLRVMKDDAVVNVISEPGASIGDLSVLLHTQYSATVDALEPCRLRYAEDGLALLDADPMLTRLIAEGMAERLVTAITYLADLQNQYGDHPGLAMVSDVLHQLARDHRHGAAAQPGSARDPDPDY